MAHQRRPTLPWRTPTAIEPLGGGSGFASGGSGSLAQARSEGKKAAWLEEASGIARYETNRATCTARVSQDVRVGCVHSRCGEDVGCHVGGCCRCCCVGQSRRRKPAYTFECRLPHRPPEGNTWQRGTQLRASAANCAWKKLWAMKSRLCSRTLSAKSRLKKLRAEVMLALTCGDRPCGA